MQDHKRSADVRVGLFVLVALALLIAGSLWIAGSSFFGAPPIGYTVLMKDSAGLRSGDRVRIAGVPVGRIQRVLLQPGAEWPVAMQVGLRRELTIHVDATARITTAGLLGTAFLQIEPGSPDAPELPPGSEIRGTSGGGLDAAMARIDELSVSAIGLLEQTSGLVDQVAGELDPIMSNLQLLLSAENAEHLRGILAALDQTAGDAGPRLNALLTNLESVSARLDEGLEVLPDLTQDVSALIADVRTGFGPEGSRLAGLLDTAQGALLSADEALSMLGNNRAELETAMRDLATTVSNLKAFSQLVKERPYSLVRVKSEPERSPGDGLKEGGQ
jgi:phospholipid/cholesterol/gamma-HCH transport system substrate-binding protein